MDFRESEKPTQSRLLYLLTYPRVASNLLVKILSIHDQPNAITNDMGGYFFLPAYVLGEQSNLHAKLIDQWTQGEKEKIKFLYQDGFNKLQSYIEQAQAADKTLFIKEHANFMTDPTKHARFAWGRNAVREPEWKLQVPSTYGNPPTYSPLNDTYLPDSFFRQFHSTFLIRHPALVFPSYYRATIDTEGPTAAAAKREPLDMIMTIHWSRRLYDLCLALCGGPGSSSKNKPLILDADDVIRSPHAICTKLCARTGLDASRLQFHWERMPEAQKDRLFPDRNPFAKRLLSTIWASEGILKDKAPDPERIDLVVERGKWAEEFGETEARRIESWVRKAMPDYEYMRERRMRPDDDGDSEEKGDGDGKGVVVGKCSFLFWKRMVGRVWGSLKRLCRVELQPLDLLAKNVFEGHRNGGGGVGVRVGSAAMNRVEVVMLLYRVMTPGGV